MSDRLVDLLRERALKRGEFRLSSGGTATNYVNAKTVTLHPEGAVLVAREILGKVAHLEQEGGGPVAAVGGPTIGADPIAGAVVALSHIEERPLSGFLIRKEPKGHGTRSQIENCPPEGSRVLLVEDVVTTGGSTLRAAEVVEEAGLVIAGIVSIVDREAGGAEALSTWPYHPLRTLSQLLED